MQEPRVYLYVWRAQALQSAVDASPANAIAPDAQLLQQVALQSSHFAPLESVTPLVKCADMRCPDAHYELVVISRPAEREPLVNVA